MTDADQADRYAEELAAAMEPFLELVQKVVRDANEAAVAFARIIGRVTKLDLPPDVVSELETMAREVIEAQEVRDREGRAILPTVPRRRRRSIAVRSRTDHHVTIRRTQHRGGK